MRKKELQRELDALKAGVKTDNEAIHERYKRGYEDAKGYRPRHESISEYQWLGRYPFVTTVAFMYAYECGYQGGLSEREAIEQRILEAIAERAGVQLTPEAVVASILADAPQDPTTITPTEAK